MVPPDKAGCAALLVLPAEELEASPYHMQKILALDDDCPYGITHNRQTRHHLPRAGWRP